MKRFNITRLFRSTLTAMVIFGLMLGLWPAAAYADFTADDSQAIFNNWPTWVVGDNLTCSTNAPSSSLSGDSNIEQAFRYFMTKGLRAEQAAGILGNLRQESGVNPASDNPAAQGGGGGWIPGVDQGGGGIAQWEGGRWSGSSGLLAYTAGKGDFKQPKGDGKNWKVLSIQLDFLWGELSHEFPKNKQPGLKELKETTTVEQATIVFEEKFERAGIPNMPRRIKFANEVFALAQQKGWANGNTSIPPGADPSFACASSGGSGVDVNGYSFPMAPQKKKSYGGLPCTKPIMNGAYTRNGRYTDEHGNSANIRTCHHDASPAFDLMDGNGGSQVYAITSGKVTQVTTCYSMWGSCVPGCMSIMFKANNGNDKMYYWYGHLKKVSVKPEQTVTAGTPMGQTATRDMPDRCWGGGPHLHIDRGCVRGNTPMTGGNKWCREPKFLDDLAKIWEGLPK